MTGDDMEHFPFALDGELDDLNLDYLGFPEDGMPIKGDGKFSRNDWDRKAQPILRIRKQDEVGRFGKEVGFRRRDRAERASKLVAERLARVAKGLSLILRLGDQRIL